MTAEHHEQIADMARKWYGFWDKLPPLEDLRFARFAANSTQLAQIVCGEVPQIRLSKAMMASAQHGTPNVIDIPFGYFTRDFYAQQDPEINSVEMGDLTKIAISVFNGTVIHEARHLKFSPATIEDILNQNTLGRNPKEVVKHLIALIANIVEDLFIDRQDNDEPYQWFVDAKNMVFFPSYVFATQTQETLNMLAGVADDEEAYNLMEVNLVSRLLVFLKNPENFYSDFWTLNPRWEEIAALARQAYNTYELSDRANLVFTLYDLFVENVTIEQIEVLEQGNGSGQSIEDGFDQSSDSDQFENGDQCSAQLSTEADDKNSHLGKMIQAFDKAISQIDGNTPGGKPKGIIDAHTIGVGAVIEKDILDVIFHGDWIATPDSRFANFGRLLQYIRNENHTPGPAAERGKIVKNRLYRIAIDSKVCGKKVKQLTPKETEIIFLGDCSGSMSGNGRLIPTINAILGAFRAVRQAGNACSVFFHTSTGSQDENPIVYRVASHKMGQQTSNEIDRFSRIIGVDSNVNFDGFAIQHVSRKFTPRQSRKIIIVFSDGTPNGPSYRDEVGIEHTQRVIKSLRRKGIEVFSVSLTDEVAHDNDVIYGREYNVYGSKNMDQQVRNLILRIEQNSKGS